MNKADDESIDIEEFHHNIHDYLSDFTKNK